MRYFCTSIVATFLLAGTSFADTLTVCLVPGFCDYTNIQDAINASSNGDVIQVMAGTYFEHSLNPNGKAITLQGAVDDDGTLLTTIDAQANGSVIRIYSGEGPSTVIKDLVLRGGSGTFMGLNHGGGGINCGGFGPGEWGLPSSPTITGCIFMDNHVPGHGGGMHIRAGGDPMILNCVFEYNTSGHKGGGLYSRDGHLTLVACEFEGNTSVQRGGALRLFYNDATISNCTFLDNTGQSGGAVACHGGNEATFDDCDFENNNAENLGGAVFVYDNFHASFSNNCTFIGNESLNLWDGAGGALVGWFNASIRLENCDLQNNTAPFGGAVLVYDNSICEVIDTTASGNSAGDWEWPGYLAWAASGLSFSGNCTADDIGAVMTGSAIYLKSDARVDVGGDFALFPDDEKTRGSWAIVDIDAPNEEPFIDADGNLYMFGSLVIENSSDSLADATAGDVYPIFSVTDTYGAFGSIVTPIMEDGLSLELNEDTPGEFQLEVVSVESAALGNVDTIITGTATQVKLVATDVVGGDGTDELLGLFDTGSNGYVLAWDIFTDPESYTELEDLYATTGPAPIDMDAGDLNGDGYADAIIANAGDSTLTVLLADPVTGGWDASTPNITVELPGGATAEDITCMAIIDWDGIGALDAVVGVQRSGTVAGYQVVTDVVSGGTTSTWMGIPEYQISSEDESFTFPQTPQSVAALGGGERGFIGSTLYGLVHKGDGNDASLNVIGDLKGNDGTHVAVGDLDGDGVQDVVCSSLADESLLFIQGDESESDGYATLLPIGIGAAVSGACIADVDSDGDGDLIVSIFDESDHPIRFLRNDNNTEGFRGGGALQLWSQHAVEEHEGLRSFGQGRGTSPPVFGSHSKGGGTASGGGSMPMGGLRDVQEYWITSLSVGSQASEPCPADADGNGVINIEDLLVVLGNYNGSGEGDVDGNGIVNIEDMLMVLGFWGGTC